MKKLLPLLLLLTACAPAIEQADRQELSLLGTMLLGLLGLGFLTLITIAGGKLIQRFFNDDDTGLFWLFLFIIFMILFVAYGVGLILSSILGIS